MSHNRELESVSVVIPALNEGEGIRLVIEELLSKVHDCEVVVVDDGSTDDTSEIASRYRVTLVKHSENLGQFRAIVSGVRHSTNGIIVTTDADYSYPASAVNELVKCIRGGYDLAIGNRLEAGGRNIPWMNRVGNRILSYLVSLVSGQGVTDAQSGLRAFRKELITDLNIRSQSMDYATEMTARAILAGNRVIEIPIDYRRRLGHSKLRPITHGIAMLRAIWGLIVEMAPPAVKFFFIVPGILSLSFGVFLAFITMYFYLVGELVYHQFLPLLAALFFLVGVLLTGIGVVINILVVNIRRIEKRVTSALS